MPDRSFGEPADSPKGGTAIEQKNRSCYEGFTLGMAAVDTIPVILFAAGGAVAAARLQSILLLTGILLSTAAGACKAGWKFVLALQRRDIPLLQKLFHILMPCGFALILLSIPFSRPAWKSLLQGLLQMPSLAYLLPGFAGLLLMTFWAVRGDRRSARANWTEQFTNIMIQGLFLTALLLAR
jgi:hypothetical protein